MKNLLPHGHPIWFNALCWGLACLLMVALRRSGLLDQPTVQVILYGCLAIYGFRVLVPFAFGSRQQLVENAETIGMGNPWVARLMCIIAMVAVFAGFGAVMLFNPEVKLSVRLGVALGVLGAGIFSLRRTLAKPRK